MTYTKALPNLHTPWPGRLLEIRNEFGPGPMMYVLVFPPIIAMRRWTFESKSPCLQCQYVYSSNGLKPGWDMYGMPRSMQEKRDAFFKALEGIHGYIIYSMPGMTISHPVKVIRY